MKTKAQPISVEGLPPAFSHYADAVRAGDTIYISGVVAMDGRGTLVGKGDGINPIRQRFFGAQKPASTLVEISRLVHDDLLLEIEAIVSMLGASRPVASTG